MYGYKLGLKKVGESIPAAPVNVVQPLLSGNAAVGTVVTCSNGSWTGSPSPTFSFDFKINGVSVQSGASNTYTPLIGDDTKTLTCLVTATNTQGSASEGASNSLVVGTIPNNTVAPVISGTNTFGSTLSTTNGTFTGTAPLTYSYQWLRNGSPISGQTASTYVIGASDSLANITCSVTATNSYGSDSEVSNTITVANFAPVNTVAPTVSPSGTQSTGTLITSNVGTWAGVTPITYEYKWTRDGIAISGATASTYTIQLADDGTTIRVEVKGTNAYGASGFVASSNSVSAVNTVAPTISSATISGTAVVGQTLTATASGVTGIPTPTLSYQWKRGATNIGTNADTYTLVQDDAGNTSNITCVVTATNAGGSANATSNTIAQIMDLDAETILSVIIADGVSISITERSATNDLYIDMKAGSIYNKIPVFYPFIGSSITSMKYNGKDPRNLDLAYRLVQTGTVNYSSTGATGNGVNGQLETRYILPSASKDICGVGVYVQSTGYNSNCAIGNVASTPFGPLAIFPSASGSTFAYLSDRNNTSRTNANTNKGLFSGIRESLTSVRIRRNGADLGVNPISSTSAATIPNTQIIIMNGGFTATQFFNGTINFSYITIGFTALDDTTMYNAIIKYNTALSRL